MLVMSQEKNNRIALKFIWANGLLLFVIDVTLLCVYFCHTYVYSFLPLQRYRVEELVQCVQTYVQMYVTYIKYVYSILDFIFQLARLTK